MGGNTSSLSILFLAAGALAALAIVGGIVAVLASSRSKDRRGRGDG